MTFGCWPHDYTKNIIRGKVMNFQSSSHGESCEFVFVHGSPCYMLSTFSSNTPFYLKCHKPGNVFQLIILSLFLRWNHN
jgi:hypothetical protein